MIRNPDLLDIGRFSSHPFRVAQSVRSRQVVVAGTQGTLGGKMLEKFFDLIGRVYYFDKPFDGPGVRLTQFLGMGLTGVWIVWVIARYIMNQEAFILLLGFVTIFAWILLWRIVFQIAANLFRW